jgi:nucleoside-diphosphate-sugar epimerase
MKKIVISGATQIVGVALTEYCISQELEVTAIVRPKSKYILRLPDKKSNLKIIECELGDIERLPTMMGENDFDVFFHLGWEGADEPGRTDAQIQAKNIYYTLQAVKAAKKLGCATFIGAGSQAEYGRVNHSILPDTPVDPNIAYGVAKYAAGKLSSLFCSELKIRHIWARIFSVYGKYQKPASMISYAIKSLLDGRKPSFTKCEQIWDFLYCSDAARALYSLGINGKAGATYNIGSGNARPLYEYIQILRDAIDPSLPLGIGEKDYAQNQVMYLCADIGNLTADTGFVPEISFEEGIKKTIEWYKRELLKSQDAK